MEGRRGRGRDERRDEERGGERVRVEERERDRDPERRRVGETERRRDGGGGETQTDGEKLERETGRRRDGFRQPNTLASVFGAKTITFYPVCFYETPLCILNVKISPPHKDPSIIKINTKKCATSTQRRTTSAPQ